VYRNRLGPIVGYDRVSGKSDVLDTHWLTLMGTEYGPNDSVQPVCELSCQRAGSRSCPRSPEYLGVLGLLR
jgi:hypothetical protein